MSNNALLARSYGKIMLSGSARAHLGDINTNYHIENAHFHFARRGHDETGLLPAATSNSHFETVKRAGKTIALLSFENGVIGGLSSLYMLKEFLDRVAHAKGLSTAPKPCEFFDIIGGTGVGGLLGIFLGSLELSIDECLARYTQFVNDVFEPVLGTRKHHNLPAHNAQKLETFVQEILQDLGRDQDELFKSSTATACKVFVNVSGPSTTLRSYYVHNNGDSRLPYVTVSQAIHATFATSGLFPPVTININGNEETYGSNLLPIDSSLFRVWEEATEILIDPDQRLEEHLDCLVSIGNTIPVLDAKYEIFRSFALLITDIASANNIGFLQFCDAHPSLVASYQICRLHMRLDLYGETFQETLKSTQIQSQVRDLFDSSIILDLVTPCIHKLARHQVAPGFAIPAKHKILTVYEGQTEEKTRPEVVSSYNARASHWKRSQPRIRGTCSWIYSDSSFKAWLSASGTSVLYCVGIVGCGKSILVAAIIDHIKELRVEPSLAHTCIHYFFDTGWHRTTQLDDLLRAMIKQLMLSFEESSFSIPAVIHTNMYQLFEIGSTLPSTENLAQLLKALIDIYPRTLYLIDGFDDLNEKQLPKFFAVLRNIFVSDNSHGSKLALFSREILGRGIEMRKQLNHLRDVYQISLSSIHLSSDINKFIETRVNEQQLHKSITNNQYLVDEIKLKLQENSGKMFLWIHFQILNIWDLNCRADNHNDGEIRRMLDNLPEGLEETYIKCLQKIENHENQRHQHIAAKALRWVALAREPLTIRQAREIVSMDLNDLPLHESNVVNSSVTDYCSNLLTVDLTNQHIHFAHPSVQQFLESNQKLPVDLVKYRIDPTRDEQECAALCCGYLKWLRSRSQIAIRHKLDIHTQFSRTILQNVIGVPKISNLFAKSSQSPNRKVTVPIVNFSSGPLATVESHHYFVRHWLSHTSHICNEDPHYRSFQQLCISPDTDIFPWLKGSAVDTSSYQQVAMHAVLGNHVPLLQTLKDYLQLKKPTIAQQVFKNHCPGTSASLIHMAAAIGNANMIRELQRVCDVNAFDGDGKTPIAWAVENGHVKTTVALLVANARIDRCKRINPSEDHNTSFVGLLALLACHSSPSIFFEVTSVARDYIAPFLTPTLLSQALYVACKQGSSHINVVKLLKVLGADLNLFTPFAHPEQGFEISGYPTSIFAQTGDEDAIKSLVAAGAGIQDEYRVLCLNATLPSWTMYLLDDFRKKLGYTFSQPHLHPSRRLNPLDSLDGATDTQQAWWFGAVSDGTT